MNLKIFCNINNVTHDSTAGRKCACAFSIKHNLTDHISGNVNGIEFIAYTRQRMGDGHFFGSNAAADFAIF